MNSIGLVEEFAKRCPEAASPRRSSMRASSVPRCCVSASPRNWARLCSSGVPSWTVSWCRMTPSNSSKSRWARTRSIASFLRVPMDHQSWRFRNLQGCRSKVSVSGLWHRDGSKTCGKYVCKAPAKRLQDGCKTLESYQFCNGPPARRKPARRKLARGSIDTSKTQMNVADTYEARRV